MATFLNPGPVFGPVISRRLGVSLGVNLNPTDGKHCTFDCVYCENGTNEERRTRSPFPTASAIAQALESRLHELAAEGVTPDVLTLAGNGEPTANPEFPAVVDACVRLRDELCPSAKIAVLSNATLCGTPAVHDALLRVDDNILKLDTVDPDFIRLVDRPVGEYDVSRVIDDIAAFDGHAIVQTIFITGEVDGQDVSNVSQKYVDPWLDALQRIRPSAVTIYTVARDTPYEGIAKAPAEVLDAIAERVRALGIDCSVSY